MAISVPQPIASPGCQFGASSIGQLLAADTQTLEHARHRPTLEPGDRRDDVGSSQSLLRRARQCTGILENFTR
jgi:hypothetical protein